MSDRVYHWRDLRFDLPAGFDDDTLLTFSSGGTVSLTVARDVLVGSLAAWVKAQEQAFVEQQPAAYVVDGPRALPGIDATRALVIDRRFNDADGDPIVQRQAFVVVAPAPLTTGKLALAIVTGTTRAPTAAKAEKAVADVVTSLQAR